MPLCKNYIPTSCLSNRPFVYLGLKCGDFGILVVQVFFPRRALLAQSLAEHVPLFVEHGYHCKLLVLKRDTATRGRRYRRGPT